MIRLCTLLLSLFFIQATSASQFPEGMSFVGLSQDGWSAYLVRNKGGQLKTVATSSEPRSPTWFMPDNAMAYLDAGGQLVFKMGTNQSEIILAMNATVSDAQDILQEQQNPVFDTSRQKVIEIPFVTKAAGKVSITLYSPDGDLVQTLNSEPLAPGNHTLVWDGKDTSGLLVPDEAWSVVATLNTNKGQTLTDDPRQYSGGEVFENIPVTFDESYAIRYQLPKLARVLVRAGVEGGPMMRSMLNWKPRPAGSNITRWSGFDADRVIDLRNSERLAVAYSGEHERSFWCIVNTFTPLSIASFNF